MDRYNFKEELSAGVFRLLGRILLPSFIMTILFAIVIGVSGYFLIPDLSSEKEDFTEFFESVAEYEPEELNAIMLEKVMAVFSDHATSFIPLIVIFLFLSLVLYNFSYNLSSNEVERSENSFSGALTNLFDKRLLHYLALTFIIGGLYQILNYLVQMTGNTSVAFLFALTVGPVYYWFHISFAAVGIGSYNFKEALIFTQNELSIERVAKVLGIGILLVIVMSIGGVIIGLLGVLLAKIPVAGMIIAVLLGIFSYTLFTSFVLSGFTALYYRYAGSEESEEDFIVTD